MSPALERLSRAALAPTVLVVYSWPSTPGHARRLSSGLLKPWAVVVHPNASAEPVHGGSLPGFGRISCSPRGPATVLPGGHCGELRSSPSQTVSDWLTWVTPLTPSAITYVPFERGLAPVPRTKSAVPSPVSPLTPRRTHPPSSSEAGSAEIGRAPCR